MAKPRFLLTILLIGLILGVGRESQATIYKYVNTKGVTTFADEMHKIPEQYRAQAVIVSGEEVDENAEKEKARVAAEVRIRQEQAAPPVVKIEEPVSARLVRSGIAVGLFIVMMFVVANIHGLQEQAQVLLRVRATLVLLLVVFLGYTHARDVAGLFGKAGETVSNPFTGIQESSAERGRKAAKAYKAINRLAEQGAQNEEARRKEIEKKFDDAEQGK